MKQFRYPVHALAADYARSAAGILVTAGPLLGLQPAAAVGWVLGGAAALFFVYFGRTIVRNLTLVEIDDEGIRARAGVVTRIPWEELCLVRLNYYTMKRDDRSGGWMQLELRGRRQSFVADSRIGGFVEIANIAAREALNRGIRIDERTLANLKALGVTAVAGLEPCA